MRTKVRFPSPVGMRLLRMIAKQDGVSPAVILAKVRGLKRSTVYNTLARLEDRGYVCSRMAGRVSSAAGRRMYVVSALGSRIMAMAEELDALG